jgi:hypothetical protein
VIEPEVIAAGNHYHNMKYQRQARNNKVSFGNHSLDNGKKKKKINWNFNTTLEDQEIAASQAAESIAQSENIEQTESLNEESINDESRIELKDHSITSKSTEIKKKSNKSKSNIIMYEMNPSENKSINHSKRSNVIMEAIDIMND